jgi:predicted ATPase/DNA-binding SARP family transcriptional activator
MTNLSISLLGSFQVKVDGQPSTGFLSDKVRALLVYLAVEQARPFRREALAGLLWPEQPENKARANLRRALANLRQVIHDDEGHFLQITRQTLQFQRTHHTDVDVIAFSGQLARPEPTVAQLEKAVSYVNGRFLEGFSISDSVAFEEWILLKREQFQRQVLDCLNQLTRHYERHNQYDEALYFAWQQVNLEPWHESGQRQLLRLLTYSGQRTAAIAHFERFQAELAAELKIPPETETLQLAKQIREGSLARETKKRPAFLLSTPTTITGPFVARETELQQLLTLLQAASTGQNHVTFITGEAGTGKTRLMQVFAQEAQNQQPRLIPLFGACQAHSGLGSPFLPFRDILAQLTGNLEPLCQNGTLNRVQANRLWDLRDTAVQLLITEAPDLIGTFINRPYLPAPHNSPTSGSTPPQIVLFEQLAHLLQNLSQYGPILLLLDDLQWADNGSIDLFYHLGRHLTGYPILLIGAFRPEEIIQSGHHRHPLAKVLNEFKETYGEIEIALNQAAGRSFVDGWLDSEPNQLDEAFRQTLYQQTKGHALFTIELVAGMQDQGDLVRDSDGYWQAGAKVIWDRLPARVEAVIAERIERLSDPQRQLLSLAAIQGELFLAEVVAQLDGSPLQEVFGQFSDELGRSHQLILTQGRERIGTQAVSRYRFRHHLFQTYVYSRLDQNERASLHERTGAVLEKLYNKDGELNMAVAGQLAWHFEEGGCLEKAIQYRQRAGNYALKLSANEEASVHFGKALKLLKTMPETAERTQQEIELHLALGAATLSLKGYAAPEVKQVYDRARHLCRVMGTEPQEITSLFWLSSFYAVRGDLAVALDVARQMLVITNKAEVESFYVVMAHILTGLPLFFMGDLERALHHFEQAIAAYDPARHREMAYLIGQDPGISSHIWAGHVMLHLGKIKKARAHLNASLAMLEGLDHAHTAAFTLMVAGGTPFCGYLTNLDKSLVYCRQALQLATREHLLYFQTLSQFYVSYVQAQMAIGRPDSSELLPQMIKKMKDCLKMEHQIGSQMGLSSRYIVLADLHGRLGRAESGFEFLVKAEEIVNKNQERYFEPELHRVQGKLLLAENDAHAAEICFQRAITIARQQKARLWELKATVGLCQLWRQQGKTDDVHTWLANILASITGDSDLPEYQAAKALMGRIHTARKNLPRNNTL